MTFDWQVGHPCRQEYSLLSLATGNWQEMVQTLCNVTTATAFQQHCGSGGGPWKFLFSWAVGGRGSKLRTKFWQYPCRTVGDSWKDFPFAVWKQPMQPSIFYRSHQKTREGNKRLLQAKFDRVWLANNRISRRQYCTRSNYDTIDFSAGLNIPPPFHARTEGTRIMGCESTFS